MIFEMRRFEVIFRGGQTITVQATSHSDANQKATRATGRKVCDIVKRTALDEQTRRRPTLF